MKNVVEFWKYFLGYYNALETHSVGLHITILFSFKVRSGINHKLLCPKRKYLRRVPDSLLAMFFSGSGEQKSQNSLSEWILMEAPNRYYIDRDNFEVFQFLRMSKYEPRVAMDHFVLELEFYGIVRNQHYTIEPKSQFEPSPVFRWNENYHVS